jgi:recombination protein RecA
MAGKKDATSRGTIKSIEEYSKQFGARRVDVRAAAKRYGMLPTGSLKVDRLLGGGIPMGKMTEIYGPPGSGKSTLATKIAGLALAKGIRVAYHDLEKALDLRDDTISEDGFISEELLTKEETPAEFIKRVESRQSWLRINGIDPLDENFHIYEPDTGEELFTMLGEGLPFFGLQIVDSVPAIMPAKVMAGEPGDASYGSRAKLLAEELPRLLRKWGTLDSAIIFINQVRENIGAQVKSQKATGGFALDHYVRCKIKTQRINRKEQGDDVITESRVKVEKNMYGSNREEMIRISGKRGIDTLHELLEFGVDFGYIKTSGNWHYFFESPTDDAIFKAAQAGKKLAELPGYLGGYNGEAAALDWMTRNGWEAKLYPLAQKVFGA